MKIIDKLIVFSALGFFLFVLFYIPATNVASNSICNELVRNANVPTDFVKPCIKVSGWGINAGGSIGIQFTAY